MQFRHWVWPREKSKEQEFAKPMKIWFAGSYNWERKVTATHRACRTVPKSLSLTRARAKIYPFIAFCHLLLLRLCHSQVTSDFSNDCESLPRSGVVDRWKLREWSGWKGKVERDCCGRCARCQRSSFSSHRYKLSLSFCEKYRTSCLLQTRKLHESAASVPLGPIDDNVGLRWKLPRVIFQKYIILLKRRTFPHFHWLFLFRKTCSYGISDPSITKLHAS